MEQLSNKAEEFKNKGNEEYKRGNYQKAIKFYSQAIDSQPHETLYTNRAIAQIQLKEYKEAINDCEKALLVNPNFAKAHKRMSKALLGLGEIEKSYQSILNAIGLDANDKTNKADKDKVEEVMNFERVVKRSIEKNDYETAVQYLDNIIAECPASQSHHLLKLEYLLKNHKLKEAQDFSRTLVTNKFFAQDSEVIAWRAKVLWYAGQEQQAKEVVNEARKRDPDFPKFREILQNIKKAHDLKDLASTQFKEGKVNEAIKTFNECLEIDPLNISFNSTIYMNLGIAYSKQKKNEEALKILNKSIQSNPDYVKAYVKRAEINQLLENWQEAVLDLQRADELDTQKQFGVAPKLKEAKIKAKQNARKDYYKILGVSKDCTDDELKKAYKKLALKWHPDRNQQSEEQKEKANKMFKDINEANTVLSDKEKRRKYDLGYGLEDIEGTGGGPDIDPSMFFGGGGGAGGFPPGGFTFKMSSSGGNPGQDFGGFPQMGGMGGMEDIFKMFGGMGGFGGMSGGNMGGMGGMGGMNGQQQQQNRRSGQQQNPMNGFDFGSMPGFEQFKFQKS